MKRIIETYAPNYRLKQVGGPSDHCPAHDETQGRKETSSLVAMTVNERFRLKALVDTQGYLYVTPIHSRELGSPILQLPRGATVIEWGPPQHGITLCIVVKYAGFIIIRHPSNGESFELHGPKTSEWYEDRVSTVDCDTIDFDEGYFIWGMNLPSKGFNPPSSSCYFQNAASQTVKCNASDTTGLPSIVGGRVSATIVGAAFSPYSTDLLAFFEGKPKLMRRPESTISGCRVVMFRRGGAASGTQSNTWVVIKKSSKILRENARFDETIEDQPSSPVADASMTSIPAHRAKQNALRRRRVTAGSTPQSTVSFCAASWHQRFQIESTNFTYELSVVKKSADDASIKPAVENNGHSSCESSHSEVGEEGDNVEQNEYITTVTTTQSETLLPMSVMAVAGSDSTVRIVDVEAMIRGGGSELLVVDLADITGKAAVNRILSVTWGPRWGQQSPLIVVTSQCLLFFQVLFHAASVNVTATPGKRKSGVPRRRPHVYIWATIGDMATYNFRSVEHFTVPKISKIMQSTNHTATATTSNIGPNDKEVCPSVEVPSAFSVFEVNQQETMMPEGTESAPGSVLTGLKSQSENVKAKRPHTLLQWQYQAVSCNAIIQANSPESDVAHIVVGPTPTAQAVTWRVENSGVIYTIPTNNGSVSLKAETRPMQTAALWFPNPPDVVRLQDWNEFVSQHAKENKVIISFSRSMCRRRTSAVAENNKIDISLSGQQITETYRALSKILELSETSTDRNSSQIIDDKVFGFLVKTCRRISSVDKEVASTAHSGMPIDTHTMVKVTNCGKIDVITRETFQTSKTTTTEHLDLQPSSNISLTPLCDSENQNLKIITF